MSVEIYKLYGVNLKVINAEELKKFEYSLIPFGKNYALVFTDKPLEKPFVEIPSDTTLTVQERLWLVGTKLKINMNTLQEHATEISSSMKCLLDSLEKELKAEKEKKKKRMRKNKKNVDSTNSG